MAKNKQHGGSRKGAGRPKSEKTKVRRIPSALVDAVDEMIERYKESLK